jgi:hypothetical protein
MISIISVTSISQTSAVIDVIGVENMSTSRKTLIYSVLEAVNLLVEML